MTARPKTPSKIDATNAVMCHPGILLAALLAAGAICASAQQQNAQQPSAQQAPAQPGAVHPASAARRQQLEKKPAQKPSPAQPAATEPAAPPLPNWPANDQANPATVVWNSQGLRIDASNSSLQQILKEVSTDTGAKVEGMATDQRVFGNFGPGPARDVLSQLLDGTGYNVLMVGDQGQGTPREIVLSEPPKGPAPVVPPSQAQQEENDMADQPPPQPPPQPQPQPMPNVRNGFNPGGQPRTPQQIIQELQQRQQQIQQMQQQQQIQQQQNSPP